MRSVYPTFTPRVKPLTTVIYRGYRGVVAPTTARKRYAELVVSIVKDTPLVFVRWVSVIGKGQHIPSQEESRKAITCFLDSTGSGLNSKSCEPCEPKQPTGKNRQQNRGEKTDCTHIKNKSKERCFLPPAKAWRFPHRRI